jgi:hypothetical protein
MRCQDAAMAEPAVERAEPERASNLAPAGVFAELARSLAEATGMVPTLHEIVDYAIVVVPCHWAAVAATDEIGPASGADGGIDRSRADGRSPTLPVRPERAPARRHSLSPARCTAPT